MNKMFVCEVCGSTDCCERCDIISEPVLCDKCYEEVKEAITFILMRAFIRYLFLKK